MLVFGLSMMMTRGVLHTRRINPLIHTQRTYSCTSTSLQSTMLAIQVNVGNENKLKLNTSTQIPTISSTQCLIENHYAGLNFHDTYTRSGLYPLPLPFTVGCEGGGVVSQVGSNVKDVKVGDKVVYLQEGEFGSYAEYTPVEYTRLMPVPKHISLDIATATAVQGLTAHYLIHDSYCIKQGDWVVVHAAAGGTGQILVQMAKEKGAHVIGTCSTNEKATIARRKGCDHVVITKDVNNEDESWDRIPDKVRDIIRQYAKENDESILSSNYGPISINDGAHVVYDGVGKASAMTSLQCLRPRGSVVFFGNASGPPPDINPLLLSKLGSLTITRPKLHDFIQTREEVVERSSDVFEMVQDGHLDINIQETFDFTRQGVIEGTKMLQNRKTVGKVLFDIQKGKKIHQKHLSAADEIQSSRRASSINNKIDNISSEHSPKSIDDAYQIQDAIRDAAIAEYNTKVIGRKIAATSKMAQDSVSVTEPFYGYLYSHSTFSSDATISISDPSLGLQDGFVIVEPELGLRMKEDTDVNVVYTPETIKRLVGGIVPSVELATSAYKMPTLESFKTVGATNLIADNGCHGALVLGHELTDSGDGSFGDVLDNLDRHTCTLEVNGQTVANGKGDKVLGHPLNALCWLANSLAKRGEILKKGDVISTGVCIDKLVLLKQGDTVSVDYGSLGSVNFQCTQ